MTNQPVRFLGRQPFRLAPIAVLTERGTVRTRKVPGQWRQTYQAGGPASWIRNGFVTVGVHCLTGACRHQATVKLATLPQDLTWVQIGRHMLCEECGGVGAVNFEPHWHTNTQHVVPFTAGWKSRT
jgi:hypothetical protein